MLMSVLIGSLQDAIEPTFQAELGYSLEQAPIAYILLWSPGLSPAPGFEHLLVPSRLAFLQRSASGTVCCGLANACALVYVAA